MSRQRRLELTRDGFSELGVEQISKPESDQLIRRALAVLAQRHRPGQALSSLEDTRAYLRLKLGERKAEVFGVVFLDNRHRIITDELFFKAPSMVPVFIRASWCNAPSRSTQRRHCCITITPHRSVSPVSPTRPSRDG